jgi:aerobic carbon-monoxide dehydrogenase medium subunit
MKAAPFEYQRASAPAEAVALLAAGGEGAKISGGGQSLGAMLNLRLAQVERLVDVGRIEALRGFELRGDMLRIGSGVTHARIEDGALPDVTQGLLPAVAADIAYRAVRNRGTVGGSLAHADPAADWVSVMRLLDAQLLLLGPQGERTVAAGEFLLGPFTTALAPDEIVLAIDVPCFSPQARWAYRKVCRKPGEFADAIAAVWVDPARGVHRALVGALNGMPHVVDGADALAALQQPATAEAAMASLLDDAGLDDPDDLYEREVHAEMLRRALADLQRPRGNAP